MNAVASGPVSVLAVARAPNLCLSPQQATLPRLLSLSASNICLAPHCCFLCAPILPPLVSTHRFGRPCKLQRCRPRSWSRPRGRPRPWAASARSASPQLPDGVALPAPQIWTPLNPASREQDNLEGWLQKEPPLGRIGQASPCGFPLRHHGIVLCASGCCVPPFSACCPCLSPSFVLPASESVWHPSL